MANMLKVSLLAATIVAGFAITSGADASVISIGLQEAGVNGGAITTIGTTSSGFIQASGAYGTFTVNGITAQDSTTLAAPDLLNSQSINTSSTSAGTLFVYVTTTGLTSPVGVQNLLSTFTTNALSAPLTVSMNTYYSNSGTAYSMSNALSASSFSGLGTTSGVASATLVSGYSLTEVYKIVATGSGNANLTIDIQAVPEPVSIALLGSCLVGLGAVRSRKARRS